MACQTIKLDKFYVPPGLRSPCFSPICAFYNSNDATIMKLRFTRAQSFYDRSNSREETNSYTNTKYSSLLILSYTHPSYLKFEIFFSPAVSNPQLIRINHYLHATPTLDCCNYHIALKLCSITDVFVEVSWLTTFLDFLFPNHSKRPLNCSSFE